MTGPLLLAERLGECAAATRELNKSYGKHPALRGLNLQVPLGAFYLLVGPNGAGKSTVLKLLLDLACPTDGAIEVFGLDPAHHGAVIRANIGYVPEHLAWGYGWMTVGRVLEHHARYFDRWDTPYAARLAKTFDIRLERRLGTLSKGQTRRVFLLMALAHRPPLLLLDEPTDGFDPVMRDETLGALAEHLAETETTVLVSTHHVTDMEPLADHVGVLRDGTLRAQTALSELRRGLRRYRMRVIGPQRETPALNGAVLRRSAPGREVDWTIWGDERTVIAALERAGSTISEVFPLSLNEATLTLLSAKESAE
ncbi:MAG: ABC transporter ATP-binding protein [Gemmatimonadales bacterium]|nr:ABC transporter ATP-binding protein [Gemmatimonadales bacterium]